MPVPGARPILGHGLGVVAQDRVRRSSIISLQEVELDIMRVDVNNGIAAQVVAVDIAPRVGKDSRESVWS